MAIKKKQRTIKKDIIYGAHPIIEMLKAKRRKLYSLYTRKPLPKAWNRIKPYLPDRVSNIQYVQKNVLDGIAQSVEHMGVVAMVSPFPFRAKMFDPAKHPYLLLLDGIQDVGNLGAILRSAYCCGVSGVVLCRSKSALLTPAVFKASAGLAEHMNIYVSASIKHAVFEIKNAGYKMYMSLMNGQNVFDVDFKGPLCIVIGSESTGITKQIRADGTAITIPQKTSDISFNASVATGVILSVVSQKIKSI